MLAHGPDWEPPLRVEGWYANLRPSWEQVRDTARAVVRDQAGDGLWNRIGELLGPPVTREGESWLDDDTQDRLDEDRDVELIGDIVADALDHSGFTDVVDEGVLEAVSHTMLTWAVRHFAESWSGQLWSTVGEGTGHASFGQHNGGLFHLPDWLDTAEQARLLNAVDAAPWSGELRRRVQHYGRRYDYGNRTVGAGEAPPLPSWAVAVAGRLCGQGWMPAAADQLIVNEYLPGQGISAHVDCVPCFCPNVAAISLGSACTMDFTSPARDARVPVRLEPGSLCVMTGPARYTWRHAIAARKSDPAPSGRLARGRRVSLTFRTVLTPE